MDAQRKQPFELTASLEDYLEAIKEIIDSSGEDHAHSIDIAKRLKVAKPSVTYALGTLRERGYLNYNANYPVTLTPLGEEAAMRVIRRHRVLTTFLSEVLRLEKEVAGATACKIEHVIDDRLLDRLEVLSEALSPSAENQALWERLLAGYAERDDEL